MEQHRPARSRRVALGGIAVVVVAALGWWAWRAVAPGGTRGGPEPIWASSRGIVAEVLNGTARTGLARQVTRLLRENGVDVIYFGGNGGPADSTTVVVRRGDAARGREVARLLGVSRVATRPDSTRRVDISVILGRDYRLPKGRIPL